MLENLKNRSNNQCELCTYAEDLSAVIVSPKAEKHEDNAVYICQNCQEQIDGTKEIDVNHWHCLNESMWSAASAVKVVAWRMLNKLKSESWAFDLLDMMYIEEEDLEWAKAEEQDASEIKIVHRDSNGVTLEAGDSVVLIKDLPVKGSSLIAKRGTAVRRISLDMDNPKFIEGRVEGQQIVIITDFVKKM